VLNSRLEWVGCTIGNDMSSRDIRRRESALSAAGQDLRCLLRPGPWITLRDDMPPPPRLESIWPLIARGRLRSRAARAPGNGPLVRRSDRLARARQLVPDGAVLLTGTGVVPSSDFTLLAGDVVEITIDGIGMLSNRCASVMVTLPMCRCLTRSQRRRRRTTRSVVAAGSDGPSPLAPG